MSDNEPNKKSVISRLYTAYCIFRYEKKIFSYVQLIYSVWYFYTKLISKHYSELIKEIIKNLIYLMYSLRDDTYQKNIMISETLFILLYRFKF